MKPTIPKYLVWTKAAEGLFEGQMANPKAWRLSAQILRLSAIALEERWQQDQERLSREGSRLTLTDCPYVLACLTASMLNGMALECLAKSIIASKHRTSPRAFRDNMSRHRHRLVSLLRAAGIILSDEERELAERLTTLVEWMGRYPASWKPQDMRVGLPARIEDIPLFSAMYSRIEGLLPQDRSAD